MITDLSQHELERYRSSVLLPDDFDYFWAETLEQARAITREVRVTRVDALETLTTYDVEFGGFAGDPIRGWLRMPAFAERPLPIVVEFVGYGGGRGTVTENLVWSSAGFAHLLVDTRGQGSQWSRGDTPDPHGSGPAIPGFLSRGIESRYDYYYRRVYTDGVRALDMVESLPGVDSTRIAVAGKSQGGGIALAVAGLSDRVSALVARVPFLCDIARGMQRTERDPYYELTRWLAQHRGRERDVEETLAYFDGVNFARRATASAWFSAALMDPVCPPSTVFGAFHEYAGPKQMTVWPYNGHEGGGGEDDWIAVSALRAHFR